MLKYKTQADAKSLYNTPPAYGIYICGKVFEFIESNVSECNTALDLYCGVGTLSSIVSKKAKKVIGVEVNKNSYLNALENLEINKISNVEFINDKVENVIDSINENIDLVVTDPPRSGMDRVTLDAIKKLKPKTIIYMSCDPVTLARDLSILKEDYSISIIKAFDMFPNTYHCESIAVLERR